MDLVFLRRLSWVRQPRVIDPGVAGSFFALMAAELAARGSASGDSPTTGWAYGLAAVITAPIVVHRRFPVVAAVVAAAGIVIYAAGHFAAFPGYAAFALAFLTSLHNGRGRGLIASALLAVGLGIALATQSETTVTASTWITSGLAFTVAWLAGDNLRIRDNRLAVLRERTLRTAAEREEKQRQAVAAERLRIARELHDVVAHSMSVVAVQAGVAHHVIDTRPELAKAALATVGTATRSALVEMRRLLGVLRQEDESPASLAPAPTLADIPDLIERFAEVNLPIDLAVNGTAVPLLDKASRRRIDWVHLPVGVDLSAFRIIQEGLTNVLRHGGPRASLRLGDERGRLRIEIVDFGGREQARLSEEFDQNRTGQDAHGHGLLGMRERVAVFGGTFEADRRAGGGFRVVATLPYDRVAEVEDDAATSGDPA